MDAIYVSEKESSETDESLSNTIEGKTMRRNKRLNVNERRRDIAKMIMERENEIEREIIKFQRKENTLKKFATVNYHLQRKLCNVKCLSKIRGMKIKKKLVRYDLGRAENINKFSSTQRRNEKTQKQKGRTKIKKKFQLDVRTTYVNQMTTSYLYVRKCF